MSDTNLVIDQIYEIPCYSQLSLDWFGYVHFDTACHEKLVGFFHRFPNHVFEVQAHVDCRATKNYNLDFSQHKAEAYSSLLRVLGAAPTQLKPKGYGESQLKTDCPCERPEDKGYRCSEEQHKQNRRLVLKVLGKDSFSVTDKVFGVNQVCELPFTVDVMDDESMGDPIKQLIETKDFLNWVDFFNLHPGWKFEIQSHTDCRASEGYNQELSEKHAELLILLLERCGVRATQLSPQGCGERELKNHCDCGRLNNKEADCSEDLHAANRRMVVKVIGRDSFQLTDTAFFEGQVCELQVLNYGTELFQDFGRQDMMEDVYWQELAEFLKAHDGYKFELQVHTDCRLPDWGTDPSHTSALRLVDNLEHMGVPVSMVKGMGYNYEQPKVICDCKAAYFPICSQEQLAQNRRIVLKVLGSD